MARSLIRRQHPAEVTHGLKCHKKYRQQSCRKQAGKQQRIGRIRVANHSQSQRYHRDNYYGLAKARDQPICRFGNRLIVSCTCVLFQIIIPRRNVATDAINTNMNE